MPATPKLKVLVYLRRSQDRADRQVLSIDGQLDEARKYFSEHPEYQPIYLPAEEKSASKPGRPVFAEMMRRVFEEQIRHIFCWDPKRIARNPKDGGEVLQALRDGALLSIITPQNTYLRRDTLHLDVMFAVGTKESDDNSDGVKRGYRAKYERGEYCGYAPTGYKNVMNGYFRNIAPDPQSAPIIRKSFELASSGSFQLKELWLIARDDLGLTSRAGKPISKTVFNDILHNRTYTGMFWHAGEWRKGSFEPIISVDLFNKTQMAMGWIKKTKRGYNRDFDFTYKGPFTCVSCAHPITAYLKPKTLADGRTVSYTYYVCTKKGKDIKCNEPQISEEILKQEISSLLNQITIPKEAANECIQLIKRYHQEFKEQRNNFLKVWDKNLSEATSKLNTLLDMRISGEIDSNLYNERRIQLETTISRTKEQIESYNQDADKWLELANTIFDNAINFSRSFEDADERDKRQLLLELGSNWQLGNKKVTFTPREPYAALVNRDDNSNWRAVADDVWNYLISHPAVQNTYIKLLLNNG